MEIICADQTDVSRCPYHSLALSIKPRLAIVEDSLAHQLPHWEVSPLFLEKRDRDLGVPARVILSFFQIFCKDSFWKIFWGYSSFGEIFWGTAFFSNFLKQMVSGSKLSVHQKCLGESPISLYYSLIYGNCLGNVVMGMEKCGKMCKNVWKCVKMCWRPVFYILLIIISILEGIIKKISYERRAYEGVSAQEATTRATRDKIVACRTHASKFGVFIQAPCVRACDK